MTGPIRRWVKPWSCWVVSTICDWQATVATGAHYVESIQAASDKASSHDAAAARFEPSSLSDRCHVAARSSGLALARLVCCAGVKASACVVIS